MAAIPFLRKACFWTKTPERNENFEPLSENLVNKTPLETTIFIGKHDGCQLLTQPGGPVIDPKNPQMWTSY